MLTVKITLFHENMSLFYKHNKNKMLLWTGYILKKNQTYLLQQAHPELIKLKIM